MISRRSFLVSAAATVLACVGGMTRTDLGFVEHWRSEPECPVCAKLLEECVVRRKDPSMCWTIEPEYFLGLDVALAADYTALVVGYRDGDAVFIQYVSQIRAGEGRFLHKALSYADVAEWVEREIAPYDIKAGRFDHFGGVPMEQALRDRGMGQIRPMCDTRRVWETQSQRLQDTRLKNVPNWEMDEAVQTALRRMVWLATESEPKATS